MGLTVHSVGKHAADPAAKTARQTSSAYTVALAGNPNVGKSTVFNGLTGMKQHTGNWPGKTVTTARGRCTHAGNEYLFIDLPGTYSLDALSAEEEITRDYLRSNEADAVIVVCDATCLERNLILVLQILALTRNVLICLNLMDEAKRKRIHIDLPALERALGVPVIGTTAQNPKSLAALLDALDTLLADSENRQHRCVDLDKEPPVDAAQRIANTVVQTDCHAPDHFDRKLDRILTGKRFGYPLMLLLLTGILFLSVSGANVPSALLSRLLFGLGDQISELLLNVGTPLWLHDALILGVYRTLAWVTAVMLPPMAIFFPLFTLLEDVGYLPRIAYNLDKPFQRCSACGKQALTMCVVNRRMRRFSKKKVLYLHMHPSRS